MRPRNSRPEALANSADVEIVEDSATAANAAAGEAGKAAALVAANTVAASTAGVCAQAAAKHKAPASGTAAPFVSVDFAAAVAFGRSGSLTCVVGLRSVAVP